MTATLNLKAKVEVEIAHEAAYEGAGVYDHNRAFLSGADAAAQQGAIK